MDEKIREQKELEKISASIAEKEKLEKGAEEIPEEKEVILMKQQNLKSSLSLILNYLKKPHMLSLV